jgi:aminoacrylate hydrolase
MAIEHKDTVLSLTALGSWARSDKYFRTWFRIRRNVLTDQSYEDYVDISQLLLFSPDYWRGQSPAVVKQRDNMLSGALQPKDIDLARIDMIMAHDALDRLSLVTAPTLVINAALDMICPPYLGRELADAIPGATFTLLPDVGHYSHVENPQLVHGHIAKFLTLHDSLSR